LPFADPHWDKHSGARWQLLCDQRRKMFFSWVKMAKIALSSLAPIDQTQPRVGLFHCAPDTPDFVGKAENKIDV
jgi:hypothetical protein